MTDQFGTDDYSNGDILAFDLVFSSAPTRYFYAVIKSAGLWFITGRETEGKTWEQLIELWSRAESVRIGYVSEITEVYS